MFVVALSSLINDEEKITVTVVKLQNFPLTIFREIKFFNEIVRTLCYKLISRNIFQWESEC